ncbi:membrane-associated protein [Alphaproteobacteria bacterium]
MYGLFLKMVDLVQVLGYFGIFFMTLIEGTFIPIPNEVTLIPVGYLIAKGILDLWGVLFCGIIGNLVGALISYYIALHYGRMLVTKYGKYFFFKEQRLGVIEKFFNTHGPISVFVGRIMPGIKHFISFPAGLGKMNLKLFCIYTGAGGALWVCALLTLGYFIGNNEDTINQYLYIIDWAVALACTLAVIVYIWRYKRKIVAS